MQSLEIELPLQQVESNCSKGVEKANDGQRLDDPFGARLIEESGYRSTQRHDQQ
jgi:hypothetical protein